MTDIVDFKVEVREPDPLIGEAAPSDNVVALPHVDLETVIEMVACLRDLGTYRQDAVRARRLEEQGFDEQTA